MIHKDRTIRSKKLRDSARGQDCLMSVPGVCNHNPETTVLTHIRSHTSKGIGQKPHDLLAVWACSGCHDWYDGRTHAKDANAMRDDYFNDAHKRQLIEWERMGLIKVA